jgi:ABC-type antimicrobial peptide transport system permease subunit
MTIVGVAGNLRTDPFQFGFEETVYRPFRQVPVDSFSVLLRIPVPGSLAAPAAAAIHAVDAELPVYDVMSLEKVFSLQVSPVRLIASLLGSFGVLALILSSVGVYSIMAHSVSERKREIGVRVAMGAERSQVVWMFVRQSLWLAGIGMVIGAPAAYGFARLLQAVFYGVIAADGMVFTMAACAIVSAAVLASYSAARRAAGIDPVATLREE